MFESLKKIGGSIIGGIGDVIKATYLSPNNAPKDSLAVNTIRELPSTALQVAKNTPAAAKTVATKVYDTAASTILPTASKEEIHSLPFLFNTAKSIPGAAYDATKEIVTHPIKSAEGFVEGIARGFSDATTNMIINNFVPKQDRESTRNVVQETLDKYLTPPKSFFTEGGQIAGEATPFVAGAMAGGAGAASLGAKRAGITLAEIIAGGGVGQASLERDASVSERVNQAMNDLVAGGVFELGSLAYRRAKPLVQDAVVKSTEAAKSAYDSYQKLTPAEKQGGYIKNPLFKGEDAAASRKQKPFDETTDFPELDLNKAKAEAVSTGEIIKRSRSTKMQNGIDELISPKADTVSMPEDVLLRNRIKAEAKTAKEVSSTMRSDFKEQAKGIASEQYGRGEVTGFFKGEIEGRKLGKKIGDFRTSKEYQAKIIDIKKKLNDKSNSQALMRESVRQFVEDNLPMSERGKYVNAAANTGTPAELNKAFTRAVNAANKFKELQAYQNEVSTRMQKIGFIKKLGEFSNTLVTDIKSKLGIKGSLRDLNPEQLDVFIDEAKGRLDFKRERAAIVSEQKDVQPSGKEITPEEIKAYQQKLTEYDTARSKASRTVRNAKEATTKFLKDIAVPFSSRLKSISPSLKKVFRNEYDIPVKIQVAKDSKALAPLFKFKKKMSKAEFSELDFYLKNGSMKQAEAFADKRGFRKELDSVRKTLNDVYERAASVGEIGFIKDYWPRMVKDADGLLEHIKSSGDYAPIEDAIKMRENDLGRTLDKTERLQIINTMLRGYNAKNVSLADVGNMKSREFQDLTPDMAKYYDDSFSAAQRYVESMNEVIQARKLFGKSLKKEGFEMPESGEPGYNIDDTIGNYVDDLMAKGELNPDKAAELSQLLKERFNPARESAVTGLAKDLIYSQTLNSFSFGINNLQDMSTALYRFGWAQTAKSAAKVIASGIPGVKNISPKLKLKAADIGLERMNEDIRSTSFSKKAVNAVLRVASLNTDSLTRNTYIDAMLSRYEKQALQKMNPDLMKRLEDSLMDKDIQPALEALRNKEINSAVEKLAYNEIANYQPVSISEMPLDYIKGDKARLLYTLKSYLVKQMDYIRQEHVAEIKKNPRSPKGYIDLARYAFALMATGASASVINDTFMGRKTDYNELLLNNFLRIFGVSRYNFYDLKENGLKSAVSNFVFPGFGIAEDLTKDLTNPPGSVLKAESVKSIPIFGRPAYWWLGKGRDKENKANGKSSGGSEAAKALGLSASDLGISAKDLGISAESLGISASSLGI